VGAVVSDLVALGVIGCAMAPITLSVLAFVKADRRKREVKLRSLPHAEPYAAPAGPIFSGVARAHRGVLDSEPRVVVVSLDAEHGERREAYMVDQRDFVVEDATGRVVVTGPARLAGRHELADLALFEQWGAVLPRSTVARRYTVLEGDRVTVQGEAQEEIVPGAYRDETTKVVRGRWDRPVLITIDS
jgi:hypothetical protein